MPLDRCCEDGTVSAGDAPRPLGDAFIQAIRMIIAPMIFRRSSAASRLDRDQLRATFGGSG
jgi:hypothetical protein